MKYIAKVSLVCTSLTDIGRIRTVKCSVWTTSFSGLIKWSTSTTFKAGYFRFVNGNIKSSVLCIPAGPITEILPTPCDNMSIVAVRQI